MLITPWLEWRIAGPRAATNAIFISRLVMSSSPGLHTNKESSHFRVQILDAFTRVYNSGLYCTALYSTVLVVSRINYRDHHHYTPRYNLAPAPNWFVIDDSIYPGLVLTLAGCRG